MTNPDTPREAEVRSLFVNASTAQQNALTSARGAMTRLQDSAVALRDKVVDDETFSELSTDAEAMVTAANEAVAAFDQIGVTPPPA